MTRRILDTSVLVSYWIEYCEDLVPRKSHKRSRKRGRKRTEDRKETRRVLLSKVRRIAKLMIERCGSREIVTPVAIEFLAGFTRKEEMELGEAFLEELDCIDRGQITPEDWKEVRRLARRIPRDGRRRQLGDCLIRALANRFARDVFTPDRAFPR